MLAIALTACNGCSDPEIKYYDAGPLPDGNMPGMDGGTGETGGPDGSLAGPTCSKTMTFGPATAVNGIAPADKIFGSVTPDELTIAWVTPNGTVQYADRTDAKQPFGNAQSLTGTFEHDRVALGADGKTLIVVMTGAKAFGQLTRTGRGQPFSGTPDTKPFAQFLLPFMGGETDAGPGAGSIGDPVLSADGKQLFFSIFNQSARDTVALSLNMGSTWGKPTVTKQPELASSGNDRRRPTGLSSDGLTLFFWDEIDMKERALWRANTTDLAFSNLVDLGDKKDAQPTANCGRLYFTNPPAPPSDVKLADKQ